ncbi:hypothetical protein PCYB_061270 [Plasmodium cynomolgi strain B]|uniref:Uncharacterized protein n=1 Tax=Plasmodium cynomolgi (strain B) TaxID=1120755 RepID=K6UTG8_PLACD|nr:hypothetical protein PCYB_061270 [Plasmodium cynomolgi strain B]GAB65395.1 hypothetical protein PCYB_061270 [Plasmodium cynomolgi strain B]
MLIVSNYYYILSSAKIYMKHFKRLKCYKTIKKIGNKGPQHSTKEINFRRPFARNKKKKYIAHLKDTDKEKETYADRTSAGDPIHHYLLDAFEANYTAILGSLSWANLNSLERELHDFYSIQKESLISSHHKVFSRTLNNYIDLFFK